MSRLFNIGGGWGNRIEWFSWGKRKVNGWKTPMPVVGDILHSPMASSKIGVFKFISVEPCGNPSDMFFATLEDIGYTDD